MQSKQQNKDKHDCSMLSWDISLMLRCSFCFVRCIYSGSSQQICLRYYIFLLNCDTYKSGKKGGGEDSRNIHIHSSSRIPATAANGADTITAKPAHTASVRGAYNQEEK